MGLKVYDRYSRAVIRSKRWKALRQDAKRRDGFRCVACGSVDRLQVDHVKRVRKHPALAFELANLQTLCARCHARKTRIEVGLAGPLNEDRQRWRDLVRSTHPTKGNIDA